MTALTSFGKSNYCNRKHPKWQILIKIDDSDICNITNLICSVRYENNTGVNEDRYLLFLPPLSSSTTALNLPEILNL